MSDCCNEFEFTSPQGTFYMDGGIRGKDGVTFYPHVSAAGILSWTNDGGKQNPDPVNIKGEDGMSAYAAAQQAGFTGTEAEFNAYLSGIGELTEDVSDLKSALTFNKNNENYWAVGGISSSSGADTTSTARLRTINYLDKDIFKAVVASGYKLMIFAYSGGAYQGVWNGTALQTSGIWLKNTIDLGGVNAQYDLRLAFALTGDGTIAVADSLNVELLGTVDSTLTIAGKAADAKIVGEKIALSLTYRRMLTSEDDLDEITDYGIYKWNGSSVPANSPSSGYCRMIVIGGSSPAQIVINSSTVIHRVIGDQWNIHSMRYRTTTSFGALATNTDLNTVITNSTYLLSSRDTFINAPYTTGKAAKLITFNVNPSADETRGNAVVQIITYVEGYTYIRHSTSAGWENWHKILSEENLSREIVTANRDGIATSVSINSSNKWTGIGVNSAACVIPVSNGVRKISMVAPKGGVIAFLRAYDAETDISQAVPRFDSQYPARILFADPGLVEYRVNDNVKFLYILTSSSTGADLTPSNITFYYDYVPSKLQELPVLYLNGDTSEMSKDNAVTLNYSFFGQTGTCTVKWQGSSSQRYAKKNYTIKFDTAFDGWNKWATFVNALRSKNGNISTIPTASRWGTQTKYCAKANWVDPSAARNIVCARLWGQIVKSRADAGDIADNRTSAPNYGAIDGFPIEIMINNESAGLYTLNIPKDKWMFAMGSGAAEYVVAAEDNANNACRWKAIALVDETDYSVEYAPDGVETSTVAASLNTAIQTAINAGADWETALAPYLDIDSVFDYFIFTCCINNHDALARNIVYGTYDGVKWFMSAYDLDTTFGVDPYGTSWFGVVNDRNQFAEAAAMHRLAELMYTYSKAKLKSRYQVLRAGVLSEANVWKELSNYIVNIPTLDYEIDRSRWTSMPGTATANIAQYMEYYRMHCKYLDDEIAAL